MNKKKLCKFSENTFSLFSIKGIELALTIWLVPYLIFKVGLENFGIYTFAMALMLFLQNVLNYGFNLVTVREIAKNKANKAKLNHIFSEVISVKLFLLVVIFFFLVILLIVFPGYAIYKNVYLFSSFILLGDLFSLSWFFLGMEQMKFKAIINLISTIFYVMLVLVLVQTESDYYFIPLAEGVALLIVSLISFVYVIKQNNIQWRLISFSEILTYLIVNFNGFINLLLPSTFSIISVFLVGVFGLPSQVSMMQVGVKLSNAFTTVNSILTQVFYPMVNRNKGLMFSSSIALLVIGGLLSLGMYVSSDLIITTWLKGETNENLNAIVRIVKILSPLPFLVAVISSYGINGLLAYFKDSLFSYITVLASFVMVISAWLLIPNFAFYGGAIALLIGRMVYAFLTYVSFKKSIKWN